MPSSDVCDECQLYDKQASPSIETIATHDHHKRRAMDALEEYRKDINELSAKVYSMDLQKVLLLPIVVGSKETIFTSRLVCFNMTFAPLSSKSDQPTYCILWHEAIQGRNAEDITSAILAFIGENVHTDYILWADNCTGQNKNWTLYTALVQVVNQESGPNSITLKYLTKGHTHMSADSAHGCIEKRLKKVGNVYDFEQLNEVIRDSRKLMHTIQLKSENFSEWKNAKRPIGGNVLNPIVFGKFQKGKQSVEIKNSFTETSRDLPFLKRAFVISQMPSKKQLQENSHQQKKKKISEN